MSSRDLARNYAVDLQISQTENNEANRSPGNGRPQSLEYGPTKYTTPQGNSSESIDDKTESDRQLVKFTSDLAGYTEAMAIATISLVIATTGLGVLGYLQLADVRRSADIAERSLTELEAPFISVRIIDKGVDKIHGITDQEFGIMRFSFSNYGRIPVHLRQVEEKLTLISFEHGLPEEFDLNFSNRIPMPRGVISVPGIDSPIFTSYLIRDISNELAAARSQPLVKNELFFYGFVRYDTIFGQKFRLGFCFIFDRYSDGWVLAGEEKYNYLKPES
jgi:hypothetical protein